MIIALTRKVWCAVRTFYNSTDPYKGGQKKFPKGSNIKAMIWKKNRNLLAKQRENVNGREGEHKSKLEMKTIVMSLGNKMMFSMNKLWVTRKKAGQEGW